LDPDLPKVNADPGRLEQVFINLLLNARDAIEEKGEMEKSAEDKRITLITRKEKNTIQIVVRDTGRGIPKEHLEKLFEPFFTTKETGKGTGLGLSISYGIVKECGGDIRAVNEKEGASFIVTLPVKALDAEIPRTEK
jgi:histidine kinase